MIKRQTLLGSFIEAVPGTRSVSAVITTEDLDRQGDIVRTVGADFSGFQASGTVLWNHDANFPIAKCTKMTVGHREIVASAEFPPEGTSRKSDEIYGLIKFGAINSTSIGFVPLEQKPLGKGAFDIIRWMLLEWSFVSVPANSGAQIISRSTSGLSRADEAFLQRTIMLIRATGGHYSVPQSLLQKLNAADQRMLRGLKLRWFRLAHAEQMAESAAPIPDSGAKPRFARSARTKLGRITTFTTRKRNGLDRGLSKLFASS